MPNSVREKKNRKKKYSNIYSANKNFHMEPPPPPQKPQTLLSFF